MDLQLELLAMYGLLAMPLVFIHNNGARFAVGFLAGAFLSIVHWTEIPKITASPEEWGTFVGSILAMPAMGFAMAIFATLVRLPYTWIQTGKFFEPEVPLTKWGRTAVVVCVASYAVLGLYQDYASDEMEMKRFTQSLKMGRVPFGQSGQSNDRLPPISPDDPKFKTSFIQSFHANCKKAQIAALRRRSDQGNSDPRSAITETQIDTYCRCSAEKMSEDLTTTDIKIFLSKRVPPSLAFNRRVIAVTRPCLEAVTRTN